METAPTAFRYRLDRTTGTYASAGADTATIAVTEPVRLSLDLTEPL